MTISNPGPFAFSNTFEQVSPVEAMELLSDKLGKTRNNQEFLHNMSSL